MEICSFCGFDNPPCGITHLSGKAFCRYCAASPIVVDASTGRWSIPILQVIAHQSRTMNLLQLELSAQATARGYDPLEESTDYDDPEPGPLDFIIAAMSSKGDV